ncbi:hypothetical protein GXW71_25540 [Roseomonas hellenica]|uniref:F-box domain-containing protein n=1 Tax=Plastoroseomonas hellenica TaxID=2687306 RepID=A0ABS5F5A1_9PROT|nr:hypothetical protein [Plastoroseomonas hellenica]MBR0667745.1 hypothetical protein [Plastoroseomonas hellenica]
MSETGSAPPPSEGSGSSGSGGDQTSDPGKTGAVQEIARNEATFAKLPGDVIGLICDQLDQKSRLALLSVNKTYNTIGAVRRKVDGYEKEAQDRVANSLVAAGSPENYSKLPALLGAIHDSRYSNEDRDEATTDFTGYVDQYLSRVAVTPDDLINFVSSLHISAQAACRVNANYKGLFEGMIHQSMRHVDSLLDPTIISPTQHTKLKTIKGQLETMRQKLHDIRTIGDAGRAQPPPKR